MGWARRPTGVTLHEPNRAFAGYTLLAPNASDSTYLIDMEGRFVHRWRCPMGVAQAVLLSTGNLLLRTPPVPGAGGFPGAPASDRIQELTWDGELVWEYRDPTVKRFSRLPNGNTVMLFWERLAPGQGQGARGGFVSGDGQQQMLGDLVREVASDGSTVYEWHSVDHLDDGEDIICPLEPRNARGGANDLTAYDDGSFLISFRILDTVARVGSGGGPILWKWGKGEISHQHNPAPLANGHVLLLDNGSHRRGLSFSRAVEVDPDTNGIVWEYRADPASAFFTHFTGGCERLPNGNTLICEGYEGRLFEVTPKGQVVWEYVSPFFRNEPDGYANRVFRTHRYGPDHPALRDKDLDPSRYGNLNRAYHATGWRGGRGR